MRILPPYLATVAMLWLGLATAAAEPPPEPPRTTASLEFAADARGLQRLAYAGHSFLAHPADGSLACFGQTPAFLREGRAVHDPAPPGDRLWDAQSATATHLYPWGKVSARYAAVGDARLDIALTVVNDSDAALARIMLQVARLNYPQVPQVSSVGVGPAAFAGGNFGAASAGQRPPVVLVDFGSATLLVGGDRHAEPFAAGVYFAENEGRINRAGIGLHDIAPGTARTAVLSLRFGPPGSTLRGLGGDLLDAYVEANPATLDWPDRRPIGKLFLASAGNGPDQLDTNPNRWFMNAKDIDIRSDAGREAFRTRVLKFAEGSVAALRQMGAQGGITWDPEGQRTGHTYYGDPRIIPWLAPEMEWRGEHELATIDAYFKIFADAGLHHGVCVRPQRVRPEGKYWVQDEMPTREERLAQLDAKIGYAVERWNSTLIYIDSDYAVAAADYRELHEKFPRVLLIPEWEQPLHFAYTAPLQSLFHHGVTGTHASIRDLYPKAFIVNLVDNLPQVEPTVLEKVRAAVRAGDIPMVNGWYVHAGTQAVRALYAEDPEKQ